MADDTFKNRLLEKLRELGCDVTVDQARLAVGTSQIHRICRREKWAHVS